MALWRSLLHLHSLKLLPANQICVPSNGIKRWVAPTLRELRKRKEKMGPEALTHRSTYVEWNYNAELFAFGKRLKENFDLEKLKKAFIHRSYITKEEIRQKEIGIDAPQIELQDNTDYIKKGEILVNKYVYAFLKKSFPKVPNEGIDSFYKYLTSDEILGNISSNVGTKDLVLCADFPVEERTLRNTLLAVIGALADSSGVERAFSFIQDFICTQLNQKDLMEIWSIASPFDHLKEYCVKNGLEDPEPRLIGSSAKNTVLATYCVGIYSSKNMIGKGFGETINAAVETAALDALLKFYGISENMTTYNFDSKPLKIDSSSAL